MSTYHRTLARMSRRESLKLASLLGAVPDLPIKTGGSLVVQAGRSGSYTD